MGCTVEIRDDEGKVIVEQPFHSFVGNFLRLCRSAMLLADQEVVNTDGVSIDEASVYVVIDGGVPVTDSLGWDVMAVSTDDAYGIVVGIGTSDTRVDTYTLDTRISDGSGNGQLMYSECTIEGPTVVGDVISIAVVRRFSNSAPDSITVNEVGLYVRMPSGSIICIVRDKLDEPVTLIRYGAMTIVMNIRVNV
jgi:hypothetical protein